MGSEKTNEFERYRQILAALYIGSVCAGLLLLAVSVVNELFFRPTPAAHGKTLSAEIPTHDDLVRCHGDITNQLSELGHVAAGLLAFPGEGRSAEIMPRWKAFSESWLKQWDQVAVSCRFAEPADSRLGEAYHRMARVHGELPTMRLKYQSLLVRFDAEQVADLIRLRRDLDGSLDLLLHPDRNRDAGEEAP